LLRFAPLQGRTYASLTAPDKPTGLDTMVLSDDAGLHVRSRAALRMLRHIGGPWRLLGILGSVVPRFIGDAVYDAIARRRLAWFGRADACTLAAPEARSRFLP
jgi:predicted DCC family thiol-disulfide oxidoreductase YuxK